MAISMSQPLGHMGLRLWSKFVLANFQHSVADAPGLVACSRFAAASSHSPFVGLSVYISNCAAKNPISCKRLFSCFWAMLSKFVEIDVSQLVSKHITCQKTTVIHSLPLEWWCYSQTWYNICVYIKICFPSRKCTWSCSHGMPIYCPPVPVRSSCLPYPG